MWGLFPWLPKSYLQKRLVDHMNYIFLCDWLLKQENNASISEKDIARVIKKLLPIITDAWHFFSSVWSDASLIKNMQLNGLKLVLSIKVSLSSIVM